jgi:formate dehydrogenase major subunit
VEKVTGILKKDVQAAARLLAGAEEASVVYGNGITQHTSGTDAVVAIANLAMLTGNTGRRGGIFALQRENNAQGACDMGALPGFLPGYQNIDEAKNRQRFEERWGNSLPAEAGLTALEMMKAAGEGKVKGMLIMGENPVASFPQPALVREALSSLDFLVVTDMFPTETVKYASVVLPAASFAEKEGTFTNFEGRVQRLHRAIEPVGESLPDLEILLRLVGVMGSKMPYASHQEVMEEIEDMVPFYRHVAYADTDSMGMDWGDVESSTPGTRRLHKGLFPSGFGRFSPVEYTSPQDVAADGYPFTLMAGSSRYHFGAGSRSSRSSRLSRFSPAACLEISDVDAAELGIANGDTVKVASAQGGLSTTAKVSNKLPPGLLFMPISFPDSPVYELFGAVLDPQVKAPALKTCAVRLERTAGDG